MPARLASWRRICSSKRLSSEVGSRTETSLRVSLDLHLGLRHLRAAHQLVPLLDELLALDAQLVQAVLELVGELGLLRDLAVEGPDLLLERDLAAEGELGQLVEAVGLGGVALGAQRLGAVRGGLGLGQPLGGGLAGLALVVLEEAQVADGLGDGLLGLGDVVREVPDQLVEHLLRVLGLVEHRVDVRADELADAPEDRGLCHGRSSRCCAGRWIVGPHGTSVEPADRASAYQRPPRTRPPPPHRRRRRQAEAAPGDRPRRRSAARPAAGRTRRRASRRPSPPHGLPPQPLPRPRPPDAAPEITPPMMPPSTAPARSSPPPPGR